jgi:hypothetical protein
VAKGRFLCDIFVFFYIKEFYIILLLLCLTLLLLLGIFEGMNRKWGEEKQSASLEGLGSGWF